MSKLDTILIKYAVNEDNYYQEDLDKAKQEIKLLLLELIDEDEPTWEGSDEANRIAVNRNQVRQELRRKAKEL